MTNTQYPNRIRLNGYDAQNFFDLAESKIRDGYTESEMKSGARMLHAEDILEQWMPRNRKSVALRLCLSIGWNDDHSADYFFLLVITNEVAEMIKRKEFKAHHGEKRIVCHEFNWPEVKQSILNILNNCERPTFDESWAELRKRFDWEYEGEA